MNLRTTIGSKLLCSFILCLGILFTAQPAEAGPILPFPQSGWGETAEVFRVQVMHGAIMANADHKFSPAAPGSQSWDFLITISEMDGGANGADAMAIFLTARHKVGVMGHNGEGPINFLTITGLAKPAIPFAPGVNVLNANTTINHLPIAGHTDQFSVTLTFTVAMGGLSITDYTIQVSGLHCSPQCPQQLPPIDKQLQEVPEWNAVMLFGSGLVGLLGYCRRRRK